MDALKYDHMDSSACEFCGHDVPLAWACCPHCARPALFPNVRAAQQDGERRALELRYQEALAAAGDRGAADVLKDFEDALSRSKAVIARPVRELDRLASSDRELFAGLPTYGDASFVLREDMIAYRASVYEDNSAFLARKHGYEDLPGFRAVWAERTKLSVAKLAAEIEASTPHEQFAALLLRQGATPEEDRFVEVHIWGPMSIRTVEKVVITAPGRRQAFRKALRDRLRGWGVEVEDRA